LVRGVGREEREKILVAAQSVPLREDCIVKAPQKGGLEPLIGGSAPVGLFDHPVEAHIIDPRRASSIHGVT